MSTPPPVHYCPDCDCCPCQCDGEWYDPRWDECPDCGRDMEWCQCRPDAPPYDNGDRMEDVEVGIANDSGLEFHCSDRA